MVLHLVSGFLGSGKTTAISTGVRILRQRGRAVGVITNDQGKYLVDTHHFNGTGVPNAEVTGGCFCCNYDQLTAAIDELEKYDGEIEIFAESVGSCTDLVATVIKPMLNHQKEIQAVTFSTFVDALMLSRHLAGLTLLLSEDTAYIWKKQIEEADLLVINKIDLISERETEKFKTTVAMRFQDKTVIYQNSLETDSVSSWCEPLRPAGLPEHCGPLISTIQDMVQGKRTWRGSTSLWRSLRKMAAHGKLRRKLSASYRTDLKLTA